MKRSLMLAAALFLLCGCSPNAREPEDLALVRVLGVDGASPVALTAVCGSVSGQPPLRGSCVDETLLLARQALPWTGEEELALTGVSWLVVGRETDLEGLLFAVLEDRELGPSAAVWLAEDAAAVLAACEDPAACLELLKTRGMEAPSAAKTLGTLLTEGRVLLPRLTCREGKLEISGEEWRYEQQ